MCQIDCVYTHATAFSSPRFILAPAILFSVCLGPRGFLSQRPTGLLAARHHHLLKGFPWVHRRVFLLRERHTGATVSYSMTQANHLDKQPPPHPHNKTYKTVKTLYFGVFRNFEELKLHKNPKHILTHSCLNTRAKKIFISGFLCALYIKACESVGKHLEFIFRQYCLFNGKKVMLSSLELRKWCRLKW